MNEEDLKVSYFPGSPQEVFAHFLNAPDVDSAIVIVRHKDGKWEFHNSRIDNMTLLVGFIERIKHELLAPEDAV